MESKARPLRRLLQTATILALGVLTVPFAQPTAQAVTYEIRWHAIDNGMHTSRNSCFAVSGTPGQPTLQPVLGTTDAILPGYLTAAPTSGRDEIFYNGFERCGP